jgi:hypothetical protein
LRRLAGLHRLSGSWAGSRVHLAEGAIEAAGMTPTYDPEEAARAVEAVRLGDFHLRVACVRRILQRMKDRKAEETVLRI